MIVLNKEENIRKQKNKTLRMCTLTHKKLFIIIISNVINQKHYFFH